MIKRSVQFIDAEPTSRAMERNALPTLQPLLFQRFISPDFCPQLFHSLIKVLPLIAASARTRRSIWHRESTLCFTVRMRYFGVTVHCLPCEARERFDLFPRELGSEFPVPPTLEFGDNARGFAITYF
jgi:hypothetical protein